MILLKPRPSAGQVWSHRLPLNGGPLSWQGPASSDDDDSKGGRAPQLLAHRDDTGLEIYCGTLS